MTDEKDQDHDDDQDIHEDPCTNPACPVHGKGQVRIGVVTERRAVFPLKQDVQVSANPAFIVHIFLLCAECQERIQMTFHGHHVKTIHRILGEVLEKYPTECVELVPSTDAYEKLKGMMKGRMM